MINLPSDDVSATDFDVDFTGLRYATIKGMILTSTSISTSYEKYTALQHIGGPEVTSIVKSAFQGNGLTSINFPKVKTIGNSAFLGNNLTAIDLPVATSIGNSAFANNNLTLVTVPKVKVIKVGAFSGNKLTAINLPEVTSIEENVFADNPQLSAVYAPKVTSVHYYGFGSDILKRPTHLATSYSAKDNIQYSIKSGGTWYVEPENVEKAKEYVATNYTSMNITVKPFAEFPFPESHQ